MSVRFVIKPLKWLFLFILGAMLFVLGVFMVIYSPWFQSEVRDIIVRMMNGRPDTEFSLDDLRLRLPMRLDLGGLVWVENGDTILAAKAVDARVNPVPLLWGHIDVEHASLTRAQYCMGNRDSATMIVLRADSAVIAPATVRLSPMAVTVEDGRLSDAQFDLYINPNPPRDSVAATESSPMNVDIRHLSLHNLVYRMNMLPTIDSLGVTIGDAELKMGAIDLGKQTVKVSSLTGSGLDAAYIVPDSLTIAQTVVALPDTTATAPWTVSISEINFDKSKGLYTTRGYTPTPGLDFGYIEAGDITLAIRDFYNQASVVRMPMSLRGTERCGVTLDVTGTLAIDSVALAFSKFNISTPAGTSLTADGRMGSGDLMTDLTLPLMLKAEGSLSASDLMKMFPFAGVYLRPMGASSLKAAVDVGGTSGELNINNMTLDVPGAIALAAKGVLTSPFNPDAIGGDLDFCGNIGHVAPWTRVLLAGTGVVVPVMRLDGSAHFEDGDYSGTFKAITGGGRLAADGSFRGRHEDYAFAVNARSFPVQSFMPALGVGQITADISGEGHGLTLTDPSTTASIDVDIESVAYQGTVYRDVSGKVTLADSRATADIHSENSGLQFDLAGEAIFKTDEYTVKANLDAQDIDLLRLKASEVPATVAASGSLDATFDPTFTDIAATLNIDRFKYHTDETGFTVDDVTMHLNATDTVTNASIRNRDLYAYFSSPNGLRVLGTDFARVTPVLDDLMARHSISIPALQQALPAFNLDVDAGPDNAVTQILGGSDMGFKHLELSAYNDSTLNLEGKVFGFYTGEIRLDTIGMDVHQHAERLDYDIHVGNRPGTLDAWTRVNLGGFFDTNHLEANLEQYNIKGKRGFDLGASIDLIGDSLATLRFTRLDPTIGYQPWTINADNFVTYNFLHKHADADLHMEGGGSTVAIYTEHAESDNIEDHGEDEDLVVDITNIRLQDWIAINPFAPPIKGNASANLRLNGHDRSLSVDGLVSLMDLYYGKERVGDIQSNISVLTRTDGLIQGDMSLWVDGTRTLTLRGALNDTTLLSPLSMDLRVIHLPLSMANAFVPGVARLGGSLNGTMKVSGETMSPRLDGWLEFDSATVAVNMLGTTFSLSDVRIPVDSNLVRFNNFAIKASNDNPLIVDGTVDIANFQSPRIDLTMNGDNMQIVNSSRAAKGADVYGKLYVGLDAAVTGNLDFLNVRATVDILPGTNVTYVKPDATSVIESQAQSDMVRFVNFNDTAAVAAADSLIVEGTLMNLAATLNIVSGSTLNIDLGGTDKVQLKSNGTLNYTMSPLNTGRITGRLNIDGGFVRYTPLMMSEKKFDFQEGSYVAFNGDMMNPQLNIHAIDRIRANVTQSGQNSRLIYFDVLLGVTGTLNTMNIEFNLATDDDATVANELATMSPSQRASTAMNLLITNMYSASGTKADANLSGNALYSFLTSQLNNWAANTIKGVDLSFGISQFDSTRSGSMSQTTQYSYQVSKSLFDDRFKIVVGGNYSTDANADENLSQNLINDISFEYLLNPQGTMLVRIFRHTGFESILEGEITQTGVGFVYKRKINRLIDMFRFLPRRGKTTVTNNEDVEE